MPKQYRSREVSVIAANTKTAMTILGSETAPGALLVPQGVSKIVGVVVAAGFHLASAGRAIAMVRIEGSGLPEGPETVVVSGLGNGVTTGAQHSTGARLVPLGSKVTPGNEILLSAEMLGSDITDVQVGATLIFS